ncbi:MAG: flhF, partial [Thermoleophilia bacterium]|nr:flhF [Thermoleophilia bacterium]
VQQPAIDPALDPLSQARLLAQRAHQHVEGTTARMEESYAPSAAAPAPTYAPPRALPRSPGEAARSQTFAASVQDTAMQAFEPQAVPTASAAASTVDDALRRDLGMAPRPVAPAQRSGNDIADALDAAVDMIDLKAMAALRNAMHASRRLEEQASTAALDAEVDLDLARITEHLSRVGVDDDVVEALVDTAVRHRRPFGGEQDIDALMREMVEETVDVRTGFPRLGRAYRAALVGASSSGKTTTVAKLAHGYRAAGLQVGIVSIVSNDPGAALAADNRFKGLDVDVQYAATPDQALHAAETLSAHDLILVDTPGSAYLDAGTFAQVEACLAALGVDDVHVVLPLATSSREARALVDAFRPLGANRMIVSRIDESRYIGQLLNFGFRLGLPMTFLSDGPRTNSDLRAASARDVANRILPA